MTSLCRRISRDKIKRGRFRGTIYTLPDGRAALVIDAKLIDIYRNGEKTISDAVRSGKACWPFYEDLLLEARAKRCRFVGVLCKENGDLWVAGLSALFRRGEYVPVAVRGRMMRALPFSQFKRRQGKTRLSK